LSSAPSQPRRIPHQLYVRSLRAAVDCLVLNIAVPLTFTPSFHISSIPRATAKFSARGSAGDRTPRYTIVRILGSLCAAVDSVVLNTAALTHLHPATLYF
jgi:hypothetical protein